MSLKLDCHLLAVAFLVNEIGQDHAGRLNLESLYPSGEIKSHRKQEWGKPQITINSSSAENRKFQFSLVTSSPKVFKVIWSLCPRHLWLYLRHGLLMR